MNDRPLNLLRCPRPARVLDAALVRPALLAGLAGVLMAGGAVVWLHMRQAQLQGLRQQLQTQLQARARQQAGEAAAKARDRLQAQLVARAQAWQGQHQHMERLHTALTDLAEAPGLRLERWHGDGRRLVLQGGLPAAGSVPQVLSRLSEAGPPGWGLQSLGERAGAKAGIDVVFEAPWPVVAHDAGGSRP